MNTPTTKQQVAGIRPITSTDWETIPSGLGTRMLTYFVLRSDLYGSKTPKNLMSDQDWETLSSCGYFGAALSFVFGGEAGRKAWRSQWKGNRDAVLATLNLMAQDARGSNRFTSLDIAPEVMRETDIARSFLLVQAFDPYYGKSPFSVLTESDIKLMYDQDIGAVAAVLIADAKQASTILRAIPEDSTAFWSHFMPLWGDRSPIEAFDLIGCYLSPNSEKGMAFMDHIVPAIGSRWNPKADRTLRTSTILSREATEWDESRDGWLRLALNHCTDKHPDRLVGWIGQAPCLYEFLNTAAKQRRGVIAARRLIKMVGR